MNTVADYFIFVGKWGKESGKQRFLSAQLAHFSLERSPSAHNTRGRKDSEGGETRFAQESSFPAALYAKLREEKVKNERFGAIYPHDVGGHYAGNTIFSMV